MSDRKTILLVGNPNVGKSTLFNSLTGMKQHTGNWTGKTVSSAKGYFKTDLFDYELIDLPGTYSLNVRTPEEKVAREVIEDGKADAIIVVCDATNLEHSLNLALQIIETGNKTLLCINLLDEAKRKGISIDIEKLSELIGVKSIGVIARKKKSLGALKEALDTVINNNEANLVIATDTEAKINKAEFVAKQCVFAETTRGFGKADRILTGKLLGYPIMFVLFVFIFWLTINGANYPSSLLSSAFSFIGEKLKALLLYFSVNESIVSALIDGIYGMVSRVVAVMLPPMAIFFPLFTILEDAGYLPRIAFNLDKPFKKCKACGKQALTMCMGFGCNTCGVTGARIIDSPRERLLAIITNSFVPCNGKFPTIIAVISMFLIGSASGFRGSLASAAILSFVILLGIVLTFLATKILSTTVLNGTPSAYILELPPYRKPQFIKVIIRSVLDRTLNVLTRAIITAAPAGLIVWLSANIYIGDISILAHCSTVLDPLAKIFGLDGIILMAFILGFPANETVIPIMIMAYLSTGTPTEFSTLSQLRELLIQNGWTSTTAVCTLTFTLLHWPCATTLITVKKETASNKWTFISAILPTAFGLILCFMIATVSKLFV